MITNNLNPILFQYSFITIRWYGLFLALGVGIAIYIIAKLFKQKKYPINLAYDLCTWLIVGGLIGARLGEILFYEPTFYFTHPLEMIMINHGGLSSHGMTIGLLLTFFLFIKIKANNPLNPPLLRGKNDVTPLEKGGRGGLLDWRKILDILIIPIPLLAMFIRIGNFFNSEIVGRATNLPWGVYFPNYELNPVLRHPAQLYEALALLIIFIILYFSYKKYVSRGVTLRDKEKLPNLFIFHLFLILYFSSRFIIEFVKEFPTYFGLTTGQWLSVPFVVWGIIYFINILKQKKN
ncbi:MAG: Prolipoprotein diacylglyceryl transferase [Candidatus Magasanikbacteria bacterium GW2011_GWC2_37_14]|uniref:Phosphatidylglycerol--prolipoprotein diacylglyceryl transferase n=1 Tax=Candidatus Magasanikbacteria bacterium GW2011_GWC2_37_14 TaxID=1619046 RepID=A0A0G0GN77_9BACT|nr:MAG: Prolipoprotein diacylglyceryl transferase [Candidatus Magasanikbacteria bacterium GW2011_GWC2_37_14]